MSDPFRISVVIPTYNRAKYLVEAIESVLRQTQPVTEIIVVDDGSTDETREVVAELDGPIRYIYQTNQQAAAARNHGLREATGDWIAFLDSDDLWLPEKIEVQTQFLQQHSHLDFVFASMGNFEEGGPVGEAEILDQAVDRYLRANATDLREFFRYLLRVNPVPTSTVMFRRSCLEKVGYFDETLPPCEDYEYWFRFAWHCRCGYLDRLLEHRRIHGSNLIHNYSRLYERVLQILERIPSQYPLASPELAEGLTRALNVVHYRLGCWYFHERKGAEARRHLARVQGWWLWPQGNWVLRFFVKRFLVGFLPN